MIWAGTLYATTKNIECKWHKHRMQTARTQHDAPRSHEGLADMAPQGTGEPARTQTKKAGVPCRTPAMKKKLFSGFLLTSQT